MGDRDQRIMAIEIERKFLVQGDFKYLATSYEEIQQGYLCSVPERTVRVRIKGEKGYITIKGKSSENGLSRYEWENEIEIKEARELIKLCESGVISKIRYLVPHAGHIFEVDEFKGKNEGLIIAEIELGKETEVFERPEWLGVEVTGDQHYYNAWLSKHPFSEWR